MSDLIVFIVIAIVGALFSSQAKKRKATRRGQPDAQPGARPFADQLPKFKGNFAELVQQFEQSSKGDSFAERVQQFGQSIEGERFSDQVQQFDQQREQSIQEHVERVSKSGSLGFESTEGHDTPGHDHAFTTEAPIALPSLLLQREGVLLQQREDRVGGGGHLLQHRASPTTAQLRQAIIMSEVLGKPVSQRRRP